MNNENTNVTDEIIQERVKAQADLCNEMNYPHFAPRDGVCWNCKGQIYTRKDGKSLITGCPLCGRTYCD